ncbi:glycosyltransferase [Erwinia sp. INIA-01]|uniref:glycosyltransferase family 2 protein n=1 Tax=Erwinia sp. INIA01 TaxID=2991500 RepID=UPI0022246523|nr:glycosyltransferase family 2 protein [Erwinia sp. INIA01]MCW1874108.1 glycosyltransferase [Erwinia sp. INIA01]
MNKISQSYSVDIICPVYNKAHLIDLFIRSFLNNLSDGNFNLILINDGSTDNIEEVVSKYKNKNIKIFNKENGGVSSARNMGLKLATARYIWFCDPDDEVIVNGDSITQLLERENADLYVFSYEESKQGKKIIFRDIGAENKKYDFRDYLLEHDYFGKNNGISTLWNKIYSRSILEGHNFDVKLSNAEDRMFNLNIFSNQGQCYVSDVTIYNHIIYEDGTLSTVKSYKKIENIRLVNEKNIQIISSYKSDVTIEKKKNITILCKELMIYGRKDIPKFYFEEHKKQGLSVFPLLHWSDIIYMIPFNTKIYKIIKGLKKILIFK